jgi:uncharacterized protein YcfJ
MKSKRKTLITVLVALLGVNVAQAAPYYDKAHVVSATPIFQEVREPHRECWQEQQGYRYEARERSNGGAILGGVFGGLLGSTVGKGSGKVVSTAAAAITGAIVGDRLDNRDSEAYAASPRYVQQCRTWDEVHREVSAYNVVYRYQGQEYTTVLPYDPGNSVRVRVDVAVADD